jgi:hypothetical protein
MLAISGTYQTYQIVAASNKLTDGERGGGGVLQGVRQKIFDMSRGARSIHC